MTYRMPCHARGFVFFHHGHVTCRALCRASGHLGHLVVLLVSSLSGAGSSTLMLAGLHADLRNIAPARLFV